jgi:hypothetical protein
MLIVRRLLLGGLAVLIQPSCSLRTYDVPFSEEVVINRLLLNSDDRGCMHMPIQLPLIQCLTPISPTLPTIFEMQS